MTPIRLLPASGSDTDSADCSGSVPRNLAHFLMSFLIILTRCEMLSDLPNRSMLVVPLSIRFRCQNVEDWGSWPHLYQLRLTLVVAPICHFCAVFLRSRDVTSRKKARERDVSVKSPQTAWIDRFCRPAPLRLSTVRRGCTQTVNWRRIRFIF